MFVGVSNGVVVPAQQWTGLVLLLQVLLTMLGLQILKANTQAAAGAAGTSAPAHSVGTTGGAA